MTRDLGAARARRDVARERVRRLEALLSICEARYGALAFTPLQIQLIAAREGTRQEHLAAGREVVIAAGEAGVSPFDREDIDRAFSHDIPPLFPDDRP